MEGEERKGIKKGDSGDGYDESILYVYGNVTMKHIT
jgi:hypothetical protein